ncbi:MAG: hypothetical protein WBG92_15295 [Thiohalocapsa sp.]
MGDLTLLPVHSAGKLDSEGASHALTFARQGQKTRPRTPALGPRPSLVLTMVGVRFPAHPAQIMAKLTLGCGVPQIVAPVVAGELPELTGTFNGSLLMVASIMALGLGCLLAMARVAGGVMRVTWVSTKRRRSEAHRPSELQGSTCIRVPLRWRAG